MCASGNHNQKQRNTMKTDMMTAENSHGSAMALESYLGKPVTRQSYGYAGLTRYQAEGDEDCWAVGTYAECEAATEKLVRDLLFTYRAEVIAGACGVPLLAPYLADVQRTRDEACNGALEQLIERTCGMPAFVRHVVALDGRDAILSGSGGGEVIHLAGGFVAVRVY